MSIHLEVRPGWDSIAILFVCNYYCAFKKESRYVVVIEKEKDVMGNGIEICAYSNVSRMSA